MAQIAYTVPMRRLMLVAALCCMAPATSFSETRLRPPARPVPLIVVLRRPGLQGYEQVTEEFRSRVRAEVRVLAVRQERPDRDFGPLEPTQALTAEQQRLRRWLHRTRPNLVFVVGQTAYDFVLRARLTLPMVHAFVLHDHQVGSTNKSSKARRSAFSRRRRSVVISIPSHPPARVVLRALKLSRPGLSKVAVLHGADTASRFSEIQAEAAAAATPPQLVSFEATSPSHALHLLHSISRQPKFGAIWLMPDLRILAPQVFQYAMNLQYRRRIPLLAATAVQVKQGALFALDFAPAPVAAQAARIAEDVLFGKARSRKRSVSLPLRPRLSINASTAARLQIPLGKFADLSPEVLR